LSQPGDEEQDILDWFEKQEAESVANLEAAARQIISLVTAFYGVVFGTLAFGSDNLAASLRRPWINGLGGLAVVLLLAALGAALAVVLPRAYEYGESRLDQMRETYRAIIAYKARCLKWAVCLFGGGLAVFAWLIISLLVARL
jgi:hypothetical protein